MTFQEKRMVASIFTTLLVFGIYFAAMIQMVQGGRFDGADASSLLGRSILILIVCSIILNIILTILFNIVFAIADRESNPSFVVDERDRLIELRANTISHYAFGAGFILSMVALAVGYSPFLVFNLIVASFGTASLVENAVQLCFYRRGF
jgi:hypothetical protein